MRKSEHVVEVLAHILGVHLGALLFPRSQFQPRDGLERNQAVLADPGQPIDFTAPSHDERVVGLVQQNGGQAGDGFVQWDRRQLTALRRLQSVGRSREQLDHHRVAIIGRLLEPIEDRFSGVAGLADFVATIFNEFPEGPAKCRCQRLHMQDDVQVFGGTKLQPCRFHRQTRGRAADQDVLVDVCRKPLLENVQPSHHGSCPFSSFSASWIRSSAFSCRLSVSESGSTVVASGINAGL